MVFHSTTRQDVKTAVGRAFQPDSELGNVRLESLTYLIFWRVIVLIAHSGMIPA